MVEKLCAILCIFVHFLYMLRVTLFTFGKCLPIQFSDMIKIWFFAFVKCLPLRFSFFNVFLIFLRAELCFAYFWTYYFFSFLSCIFPYKLSFSVHWLSQISPLTAFHSSWAQECFGLILWTDQLCYWCLFNLMFHSYFCWYQCS